MFYLLQKSFRLQLFVLIVAIAFCVYLVLTAPLTFIGADSFLPYAVSLGTIISQHPFSATITFLTLLLLQLLLLFLLFKKNRFTDQKSTLPCIFYTFFIVVSMYTTDKVIITPVFIINFVTTCLFLLGNGTDIQHHKSRILIAGILIGIATLYDRTAFLLLIALLFMLFTNYANAIKDTFVTIIGILIPYIYIIAYHFLIGDLVTYLSAWELIDFHFPLWQTVPPILQTITLIISFLVIIYLLIRLKLQFDYKLILARKRLLNMIFLFIILIIMVGISNQPFPYSLGYLFVPLAIFFSAFASSTRFAFSKEIIISLLCSSCIYLYIIA